jgi:endonuclease/exonuclease/phosphatase family metal-dependent hydrolase
VIARLWLAALLSFGLLIAAEPCAAADAPANTPAEIRVMSYNIRYGTARDGENHWNKRKEFLVDTVRAFDPDLLGTQETLALQRDYLAQHLDGYEAWGVGRDDGKAKGEFAALFYKQARFERLDGGNFWLSETPEKVGSHGWDAALTRLVSWVKLRDRRDPARGELVYFNTHFDHRGRRARLESAKLLRRKIVELAAGRPVIVTGDFNANEGSTPYQALFEKNGDPHAILFDTFRAMHPHPGTEEGSFSGFHAERTSGPRIDWIGCTSDWQIVQADIDRTQRGGHTPSDHFAVFAVLRHKS